MAVVYVVEQGAIIKKDGGRISVEKSGERLLSVPLIHVDRLLIFGNVQITAPAVAALMETGVDVAFLSMRGKLRGILSAVRSKNVFLRMAQHDRWRDPVFRIRTAKAILKAKISNQKQLLQRYARNHPELDLSGAMNGVEEALAQIEEVSERGTASESIGKLMGIEGRASGAYFSGFGRMIRAEFEFQTRRRRPAPDPINSLLSLGYTMLTNEIASLLEAHSFDPLFGFLHSVRYGRKSLALDLVEEFRQPVVDRFVLRMVNLKVFKEEDFRRHSDGGVYLTEDGLRRFFERYEDYIEEGVSLRGKKVGFRKLFDGQVLELERAIMDNGTYRPFTIQL
jgi:CRISPR-associated protein Cas1